MAVARALCPTLVGRDAQLSDLEDALLAALRGDGSVVVLGGEAGMGKTRLAAELERRARSLGCVVMAGACSEAELALPYLPFLEAIGNHLATVDVDQLRTALGAAAADLAQLFPQLGAAQAPAGDAVQSKLRLFEAILILLRAAAGDRGLLLVLEDLHWADPATRELLDYMTRRLRATNVLVVATYRSEELHRKHALLPTIQGWKRAGTVRLIDLQPLDADRVCDMLCSIFDQEEVSDEFAEFMRDRAEGNPFVIEEMLKEAIDRGDIFRTSGGWDRKAIRELRVPPTVRDSILLRVERLDPRDAEVLSAAAVAGRTFDAELLAATAQLPVADVLESLQRCVLHQLVEEDGAGGFRFRHALTREAIYEDMVTPRRQQLHGRVVDVLRDRNRPAIELAHHLLLAHRDQEAVAMCLQAAAEANRALAYGDAADLLTRAVGFITDPGERGSAVCQAADAHWNAGEPARARRLLEEGIPLLEGAGREVDAAGYRVLLGRCYWELQRSDLARREFEAALVTLAPHGPSEALAVAHVRLAGLATFNGQSQEALAQAERAAEVAAAAGAERALAWAWVFEASALIALGRIEDGVSRAESGFRKAVEGGFWFQAQNAVFNMVWTCVHLGEGRRARAWLARHTVLPPGQAETWVHYMEALCAVHEGDLDAALEAVVAAQELAEDGGFDKSIWRSRVLQAHVLAELDRGREAEEQLPPLSSRVDTQDQVYDTAARVETALAAGDAAALLEAARAVDPGACWFGSPGDALARAAIATAPELVTRFAEEAAVTGECRHAPRFRVVSGAAALAAGDAAAATAVLADAEAAFRAEGFVLDAWHTSLLLARAHAGAGDRHAAERVLRGAVAEAAPRGARLVARLAHELGRELGLDVPPPPAPDREPGSEPWTTGERLVTVLFADVRGYTAASAKTAPAETADRIAALQRWATAAVAAHHGVVDKFAGDAVMATFNVSGASVDHAQHAVECGVELIQKGALAAIPVGVGIATGPAIVGRLTESANLSVLGETTNLAARLQAQSGAGELTLASETFRRLGAGEVARFAPAAVELELKGFERPVAAYRLEVAAAPARGG